MGVEKYEKMGRKREGAPLLFFPSFPLPPPPLPLVTTPLTQATCHRYSEFGGSRKFPTVRDIWK